MPEEPDVSPEELEILDRVWSKLIEDKQREREARIKTITVRILQALQSRPDGMQWAEIRGLFDQTYSDQQIRQVLVSLTTSPSVKKVEEPQDHSDERYLLAAG